MTEDADVRLVAEQFSHAVDLLRAENRNQADKIKDLIDKAADFESRIRTLTDTATQFKLLAALATGGGLLGLIDLLRALLK